MANVETTHVFNGSVKKVFEGIANYEKYVDHIPGVNKIKINPPVAEGSVAQIRYEVDIIKTFYYVLDMFEEKPNKISWQLAESNVMKANSGSWVFEPGPKKGTTLARYSVDVAFRGLVPSALTNKVAEKSLPSMFEGMQQLIDS